MHPLFLLPRHGSPRAREAGATAANICRSQLHQQVSHGAPHCPRSAFSPCQNKKNYNLFVNSHVEHFLHAYLRLRFLHFLRKGIISVFPMLHPDFTHSYCAVPAMKTEEEKKHKAKFLSNLRVQGLVPFLAAFFVV